MKVKAVDYLGRLRADQVDVLHRQEKLPVRLRPR
jgi:hypothetical protein